MLKTSVESLKTYQFTDKAEVYAGSYTHLYTYIY